MNLHANIQRKCTSCGIELTKENWAPSRQKNRYYICKGCGTKRGTAWRKANPASVQAISRRWREANPEKERDRRAEYSRRKGHRPFDENKECSLFLGVHVAERVLSKVFKDVEVMPHGNPGYDFICNHRKLIDVKSACASKRGDWKFAIRHNTIADYFLCVAFDNRSDLTPLHVWLLPGDQFNHFKNAAISTGTIHKWDEYRLDISKILTCCDTIRGE